MDGQIQRTGSGGLIPNSSTLPRRTTQQPLSCTHCRQRKIKCDKSNPCSNCKRSGLDCVFPERVRHPKKRRDGSKANNEELLRRLGRMEELIEKLKVEGKDMIENRVASSGAGSPVTPESKGPVFDGTRSSQETGMDVSRFIGSGFWRSLTNEVEGLRHTMDDVSDGEEISPNPAQSPSETTSSHSYTVFGPSALLPKDLPCLHPTSAHIPLLCDFYARNVDPMFKVLHIPTLRNLISKASADPQKIPSGNYIEALLFSVYYAAITSLTEDQCQQCFQDGRESLLARYRSGTETALVNADLMNTTELGTIQALAIFIIAVRSNDDSQFAWTLTSIAVRLASAHGLHRENSKSGLTPFTVEIRRRLWWQIVTLDVRACEDRGSDPIILPGSFNTKMPLNINDSDMAPDSTLPILGRPGFTEMTKTKISHYAWESALAVSYVPPVMEGDEDAPPKFSFEQKETLLNQLESRFQGEVLMHCDPSNALTWTAAVITRLIMARLRLSLYHPPLHDNRSASHQYVARDLVLLVTVQCMELSHLLDAEPAAEPWRWFFRTYVQWHSLAAALAELCVQDRGPLVERAWRIIDVVFDDWAARIADSSKGMLWRPIRKLMTKAQAKRNESRSKSISSTPQQQQPLPHFASLSSDQSQHQQPIEIWNSQGSAPDMSPEPMRTTMLTLVPTQPFGPDDDLTPDIFASLNVNESMDTINWAEWDAFMQDYQMPDVTEITDVSSINGDMSHLGAWW